MTEEQKVASKAARKAYMKEYHHQWYEKNRQEVIERVTKFRNENPDVIRERKAKYARENRELIAAKKAARYLAERDCEPKRRALSGTLTISYHSRANRFAVYTANSTYKLFPE